MRVGDVEQGVPLRTKRGGSKYPVAQMMVGDSFLVIKDEHEDSRELIRKVNPSVFKLAKRYGYEIACRTVFNGIRIWRTK